MAHDQQGEPVASGTSGVNWKLVSLLIGIGVAVAFFFQNGGRTRIWILAFSFTSKTRTAIIVAIALGVLLDRLFISWRKRRKAAKAGR